MAQDTNIHQRKSPNANDAFHRINKSVRKLEEKAMDVLERKVRSCCSIKTLKRKLPICKWLPKYNFDDLIGDCIAGLTVGLTVLPQAIAYSFLAGLPPNYGLYSGFMGCFVYLIFGSCKDATIGPTAVMSMLTHDYAHGNPDIAVLLAFTSGVILLIMALFNLGFVVAFVSKPVTSGFTTAAALAIISSQLKPLFGLKYKADGVIEIYVNFFKSIGQTRWQDLTLGVISIVIIIFLKKFREFEKFRPNENDSFQKRALKMVVFLISCGRNAIVVLFSAILAFILSEIKPGLPPVGPPPFSTNNGTTSFVEMMQIAGAGVIVMPLIAILESMAIGISFSKNKPYDGTQEMSALGLCNVIGSFFSAMTTTASFSRSAINSTSGVRTTAGGIVTGILVILSLVVLTPYVKFIPLSALAAVIMCAVVCLIEYHNIIPIWRVRKIDELVLWVSFLVCLFWKLEYGILVGVAVNFMVLLYSTTNIKIEVYPSVEEANIPPYIIVEARLGLIFVSVQNFKDKVSKVARGVGKGVYPIIVDCQHFSVVDYTASQGIHELLMEFSGRSQPILFINASRGVERALRVLNPNIVIIERAELIEEILRLSGNSKLKMVTESVHLVSAEKYRSLKGDDVIPWTSIDLLSYAENQKPLRV